MKIKLKDTISQDQEFEVEFPIYRKHPSFDGVITYTRIDKNPNTDIAFKAVHIEIADEFHGECNRAEIKVTENYRFDDSGVDYHLGRGMYQLSKQDFDDVLKKAQKLVNSVQPI